MTPVELRDVEDMEEKNDLIDLTEDRCLGNYPQDLLFFAGRLRLFEWAVTVMKKIYETIVYSSPDKVLMFEAYLDYNFQTLFINRVRNRRPHKS